jgi:glycolate oxidase
MSIIYELSRTPHKGNILTSDENLRPFECDGLSVYKQKPLAVVLPETIKEVKQILKICRENNTPVITRGAGTGLAGGAMPLENSVVLGL